MDDNEIELQAKHDERRAIRAQRDELLAAVKAFCEGAAWAAREWKEQEHIKPLFDLAAKAEGGQQ